MPGTSASCRRSPDAAAAAPARGFTLLELLVVLALMAMLMGIAVPGAVRALESARERGAVAELQVLLDGLPVEAFKSGRELSVTASELQTRLRERIEWPAGWHLSAESALRYGPSGVAIGGRVVLDAGDHRVATWAVEPVTGVAVRTDGSTRR